MRSAGVADSARPAALPDISSGEPSTSGRASATCIDSTPRTSDPLQRHGSAASYRSSSLGPGIGNADQVADERAHQRSHQRAEQGYHHGYQAIQSSRSNRRRPPRSASRTGVAATPAQSAELRSGGDGELIEGRTEAQFWDWVQQFQEKQGPLLCQLMESQEQNGVLCVLHM